MKFPAIVTAVCAALGPVLAPDGWTETVTRKFDQAIPNSVDEVSGIRIPDSKLAHDAAQFVLDTEGDFLFQHSTRVFYWAALAGKQKGLIFDPELLYTAAMFHDVGLTADYRESHLRFEVDSANAARDFLRSHDISEADSEKVWLAIALHTTPGISAHLSPIAALTAEGEAPS